MASPDSPLENTALAAAIRKITAGEDLTRPEARAVMDEILSGEAGTPRIVELLSALHKKGESVEEVIGFAESIRAHAAVVRPRRPVEEDISDTGRDALVDTAGTGGDSSGTFNISTATALVVAGCGVRVAKHGNRSISTRCGSADVLEALGVKISLPPEHIAECIDTVGIGFLFAPALHGAMKHAQAARRELKDIRTVFNMLGPLCNPAGASAQVIGVYDQRLTQLMAQALAHLGVQRGFVVHGADGLDEISNTGETAIAEVRDGEVHMRTLTPEEVGIARCTLADLQGGDVPDNVRIIHDILNSVLGPKRDVVLMNAAAALLAAGRAPDMRSGIRMAGESIDSGSARRKLGDLIMFSNRSFES